MFSIVIMSKHGHDIDQQDCLFSLLKYKIFGRLALEGIGKEINWRNSKIRWKWKVNVRNEPEVIRQSTFEEHEKYVFKSAHDKCDSKIGENQEEGWFNFWPGRVAASWICSGDKHLFPIFCSKNAWGNRKAGSVPESLTPLSTGEKCHLKNPISTPPGTCATIRYESLLQFETIPLCPLKDAIPLLLLFLLKCLSSTENHILNLIIS